MEWIGSARPKDQWRKKLILRMPDRPASAHSFAVVISVPGGQSYADVIRYLPEAHVAGTATGAAVGTVVGSVVPLVVGSVVAAVVPIVVGSVTSAQGCVTVVMTVEKNFSLVNSDLSKVLPSESRSYTGSESSQSARQLG